jgi:hypothetical protein
MYLSTYIFWMMIRGGFFFLPILWYEKFEKNSPKKSNLELDFFRLKLDKKKPCIVSYQTKTRVFFVS